MRKIHIFGALLTVVLAGCESKTPTGPGTVTVEQVTTTTVGVTTTTTIPGPGGTGSTTTIPATTTSPLPPTNVTRRYVGASTQATVPNDMTLFFQYLSAASPSHAGVPDGSPLNSTMARYAATGVYRTSGGGGGIVKGDLSGELDNGQFSGTLTFEAPGCTAEREYSGIITAALLSLSAGRTLRDCKDTPLGWSSLTLVRGDGATVTTTTPTTTTPGSCSYDLVPGSATVAASGAAGDINVTTQPGCSWSTQSFVPWVTVQPAAGSGSGKAQYSVQANAGAARTATLVIAGKSFLLTQLAAGSSGPTFATVYPHMQSAGCGGCHGFSNQTAAEAWARSGVISNPPAASAPLVTRPAQIAPTPTHTGGTLWPQNSPGNLAAIAWINGGRQ